MARPKNMSGCKTQDCTGEYYAKQLCRSCYQKAFRNTFPSRPTPTGGKRGRAEADTVGYRGAHLRVERHRGKARTYFCVDCPNRAFEWSLEAEDNLLYENGKAYSLDVNAYAPRCPHCHRVFDGVAA